MPCLEKLRSRMPSSQNPNSALPTHLPFTGGYLGWLGYDLAWEIERLPYTKPDTLPFPVAFWYEPSSFAVIDHQTQNIWLAASDDHELTELSDRLNKEISPTNQTLLLPKAGTTFTCSPDQQGYEAMVNQAKQHIYAGNIFHANLSMRYGYPWASDGWQLYRHLQKINPSAETRPIAGTRPRGKDKQQDLEFERELLACTKEQAEHIMLVDLERNDLGRVCEWGSVIVDELFAIERYSHVMHLVSNVVGTLRSDLNFVDLIRATFPGGTITGCPKVRCMEIVEKLEPQRRSLFYGSCGYIDRRGNIDLN
ncbi:MAG: chorismate-binding protein, partial [Pseudanabaena sp. LacPavin_0818_WC45_MAG_42_6]|nr:chorismate-binding protein [Pseudanabaena sp. LacPavin_0818_WC45_MAG_42_6]